MDGHVLSTGWDSSMGARTIKRASLTASHHEIGQTASTALWRRHLLHAACMPHCPVYHPWVCLDPRELESLRYDGQHSFAHLSTNTWKNWCCHTCPAASDFPASRAQHLHTSFDCRATRRTLHSPNASQKRINPVYHHPDSMWCRRSSYSPRS